MGFAVQHVGQVRKWRSSVKG